MEFITENWESIVAIFTGVVTLASIVAKITTNETDNKIVGVLLKIVDMLAINTKPTIVK